MSDLELWSLDRLKTAIANEHIGATPVARQRARMANLAVWRWEFFRNLAREGGMRHSRLGEAGARR